jgi:hypothetical protein
MDETAVALEIFSPRWGHKYIYKLVLAQYLLVITQGTRSAKCAWRENRDPEWSGESLRKILENDLIYPPAILQDLIEHAWVSWRNGELDSSAVNEELQAVTNWLNGIARDKPKTDFWRKYFNCAFEADVVIRRTVSCCVLCPASLNAA